MVKGARGESQSIKLLLGGGNQRRMTVAEVVGRVCGEEIEILHPLGVGQHRAPTTGGYDIERMVIVRDVLIFDLQQSAGTSQGVVHGGHDDAPDLTSWVQH